MSDNSENSNDLMMDSFDFFRTYHPSILTGVVVG